MGALEISLGLVVLVEKAFAGLYRLVDGLDKVLTLLILAKKLFAHEEHSNAETVALDILVMAVAGANLLTILDGIAAEGHSRAVTITVIDLVLGQSLLHQLHYFLFRKEFVRSALDVLLRKRPSPLERSVKG